MPTRIRDIPIHIEFGALHFLGQNTDSACRTPYTLVQRRAVTWDSRLGLSTNHNELVSFGYERDPMILSLYQPVQRHQACCSFSL